MNGAVMRRVTLFVVEKAGETCTAASDASATPFPAVRIAAALDVPGG
jgi:hypothetical protein